VILLAQNRYAEEHSGAFLPKWLLQHFFICVIVFQWCICKCANAHTSFTATGKSMSFHVLLVYEPIKESIVNNVTIQNRRKETTSHNKVLAHHITGGGSLVPVL
jgi:hypothetical protein